MNSSIKTALLWGAYIGGANMLWLYLAYYLGLHTSGFGVFQIFILSWLLLNIAGYVIGLRAVRKASETFTYFGGLKLGGVMALVSGLLAIVGQVGYFKVVNPGWPEYMVEEAIKHYETQSGGKEVPEEDVERLRAQAEQYFSLGSYAVKSASFALILGVILSAIVMLFLCPSILQGRQRLGKLKM